MKMMCRLFTLTLVLVASPPNVIRPQAKVEARDLLTRQPDFMAEETIDDFESAIGSGFSAVTEVAKKGDTYRASNSAFIFFFRPNRPYLRLFRKNKTYEEINLTEMQRSTWHSYANHVEIFAKQGGVNFEIVGATRIDGRECIKIKATPKDNSANSEEALYFYVAKDLRHLVVRTELVTPNRRTVWSLKNISFDVPAELFEIPRDYKPENPD